MIKKKKEDYLFSEGEGRPFPMIERLPIGKTQAERTKPEVINLSELNVEGAPRNYHRKAGRKLQSFMEGREVEALREDREDDFDIE